MKGYNSIWTREDFNDCFMSDGAFSSSLNRCVHEYEIARAVGSSSVNNDSVRAISGKFFYQESAVDSVWVCLWESPPTLGSVVFEYRGSFIFGHLADMKGFSDFEDSYFRIYYKTALTPVGIVSGFDINRSVEIIPFVQNYTSGNYHQPVLYYNSFNFYQTIGGASAYNRGSKNQISSVYTNGGEYVFRGLTPGASPVGNSYQTQLVSVPSTTNIGDLVGEDVEFDGSYLYIRPNTLYNYSFPIVYYRSTYKSFTDYATPTSVGYREWGDNIDAYYSSPIGYSISSSLSASVPNINQIAKMGSLRSYIDYVTTCLQKCYTLFNYNRWWNNVYTNNYVVMATCCSNNQNVSVGYNFAHDFFYQITGNAGFTNTTGSLSVEKIILFPILLYSI